MRTVFLLTGLYPQVIRIINEIDMQKFLGSDRTSLKSTSWAPNAASKLVLQL